MRWNLNPLIIQVGAIELRWYGLLFATGLLLCAWKAPKYFSLWGLPKQHAERLTLWVPVGMLLGAHYIHLIFYEPEGLLDFPRVDEDGNFVLGRFFSLGSGLASHGGGLGCVLAVWLFWRLYGKQLEISFWRYADAVMIVSIFVYPFVRLGNFANHEILGRVTDGPWGVRFTEWGRDAAGAFIPYGYTEPRHPVVLYEAFLYFCELAFATLWFQPRFARKLRPGATFFLFLTIHFTLRFVAEFAKDSQHVDEGWALNMGHLLSLPIILGCGYMILFTKKFDIRSPLSAEEKAAIDRSAELAEAEERRLDAEAASRRGEAPPAPAAAADAAPGDETGKPAKGGKKKSKKSGGERRADA